MNRIAIRRENKNHWEKRAPLVPDDIVDLVARDISITVQPSEHRTFPDAAYTTAGAALRENIDDADLIMGVKEVPAEYFDRPAAWFYFSHTIKGQPQNMPMLQALMDSGSTLFDYELITNEQGQRLVFFGRHAGYAGAIETLVALSRRWEARGLNSPFTRLQQPYRYTDLAEALSVLEEIGQQIQIDGLPQSIAPLRIAVMGYGNVSDGVRHILDALPTKWHEPEDYLNLGPDASRHQIHATVLREKDMVEPRDETASFDLQNFYDHPDGYRSAVHRYLRTSTAVIPTYYWDERYPRYIPNADLKRLAQADDLPLEVIGDITCDIQGSVEPTIRPASPGEPVYTFDPLTGEHHDGVGTEGVAIMAVDNLPCELSVDASHHFSAALAPFIPTLAQSDLLADSLEESGLPPVLQRACIVWRGRLTDSFENLQDPLNQYGKEA